MQIISDSVTLSTIVVSFKAMFINSHSNWPDVSILTGKRIHLTMYSIINIGCMSTFLLISPEKSQNFSLNYLVPCSTYCQPHLNQPPTLAPLLSAVRI